MPPRLQSRGPIEAVGQGSTVTSESCRLRGYKAAAPLKQCSTRSLSHIGSSRLRGYKAAAPLKRHASGIAEAPAWGLRGYKAAAPLKQFATGRGSRPLGRASAATKPRPH